MLDHRSIYTHPCDLCRWSAVVKGAIGAVCCTHPGASARFASCQDERRDTPGGCGPEGKRWVAP